MPSRIIREGINDSEAVNQLSDSAELFYRRLMLVVDDFGRFEAKATLLRAKLFAFKLDAWPEDRVEQALQECSKIHNGDDEPLVLLYSAGKRTFLQISNFGQRKRSSKYPGPGDSASNGSPPAVTGAPSRRRERVSEASAESESETKSESEASASVDEPALAPLTTTLALRIPDDCEKRLNAIAAGCPDAQDLKSGVSSAMDIIRGATDPDATLRQMETNIPLWFDAMREGHARTKTLRFLLIDQDYLHQPRRKRGPPDKNQARREEVNQGLKDLERLRRGVKT
jgi:hypothetical protein